MNNLKEVKADALSDSLIRKYLPNCRILKYSQFKQFRSLDEILPNNKDYVIILYETTLNSGHWCCITKFKDCYQYFDSYGKYPSQPLEWNKPEMNKMLGQDKPYLSMLFDKSKLRVVYNPVQFQSKKSPISTCGAYDTLRASELQKHNTTLEEFNDMLEEVKKGTGLNYDEIVSNLVHMR
jgi:hypothetical protein